MSGTGPLTNWDSVPSYTYTGTGGSSSDTEGTGRDTEGTGTQDPEYLGGCTKWDPKTDGTTGGYETSGVVNEREVLLHSRGVTTVLEGRFSVDVASGSGV